MSFLQIAYREPRHGYWGLQTSTLNWCEEDYNITYYCAEFVNTATNATFLWLGIRGIRDCIRYGHPPIFIVAFVGYMIVGIGSIAFHATLKYSMQLADELPMIYATCIIGYATFTYGKSRAFAWVVASSLIAVATLITVVYAVTKDPIFHQVSYAALTCSVVFHAMYIMEHQLRPALHLRSPDMADRIMKKMWNMAFSGISLFLIGFAIWNLDNIYCVRLRSWREILLLPWALVLEGHGWWHLFTGLGGTCTAREIGLISPSLSIFGNQNSRNALLCLASSYWDTAYNSIPRVVPLTAAKKANGSASKKE